ncbi:solute carrier family 25 member 44-like [Planoprotostelium fungivorum]|uniref:Solute carrier family 25 member 44-like n=1 Tax=Planoprotostelium fungivorum TaxID=1890364 RepID=A0A2P6NUX0_9EUKA|nr:solute carrier family 25 member 44-like [Planoprotostelium fungivorum]
MNGVPRNYTGEDVKVTEADDFQFVNLEPKTSWDQLHLPTLAFTATSIYVAESVIYHPFDVLRTRIQTTQKRMNLADIRTSIKTAGFRGMYTGYWPNTIGNIPGNAVYLLSYNFFRSKLSDYASDGPVWVSLAAGGLADLTSNLFYAPVDVVVQRLFIQNEKSKRYKNATDAIGQIYRADGIKGFYRGFGAVLMTNVPSSAVWWASYESCKEAFSHLAHKIRPQTDSKVIEQNLLAQFAAGATAGVTMVLVTNPLEVVKTRLQTQHFSRPGEAAYFYANTWQGLRSIVKTEGPRALYKGVLPRCLYSCVFSSLSGVIYEYTMKVSRNRSLLTKVWADIAVLEE